MSTLFLFFLGWLITQTICLIWFYSPFRLSISPLIFKTAVNTFEEFETLILIRHSFFGKLLSCYICFSFWTSIAVGIIGSILTGMPLWYAGITALTYPSLCYLYKSIVD
jgi:hypothetical protein